MNNIFKKGLILGGILAAAAAVGLALSKEAQELSEDLQKDFKVLIKNLKKNLGQLEDVTKDNFDDLVNNVVEEYTKKKALTEDAKQRLIKALQANWQDFESEYLDKQAEDDIKKQK